MKKLLMILWAALIVLLCPLHAEAATEGDVYAALRSIGVPESYVSQAAGVLARGTSDGAGVYRSDGTYYSYSWMVSYIYANRETILLYCGIDPDTGSTAASTAETAAGTAGESSETTSAALLPDPAAAIDMIFADETTDSENETTTSATTTTTTVSASETTEQTSRATTSRTAASAANDEESSGHGGAAAAAAVMILAAAAGLGGMAVLFRRNAE